MLRLWKDDLREQINYLNNKHLDNTKLEITFYKRLYTRNIVEITWYKWWVHILSRKFHTYKEARYYLIWVQDWLDVL